MTKALKKAWDEVNKLPPEQQDAIGEIILQEIASERKWNGLFEKSSSQLEKLADEGWREFERGETEPL